MKRVFATTAIFLVAFATLFAPAWAAGDPYRSQQWGLNKIRADQAWSASKGSGVTIAIVDTGIDLGHPDLRGKIASHYSCIGGACNSGTTAGDDDNGHGSHVAGIAAAATSNGVGVAGVAPAAKLMAVKVLDSSGSGDCDDIAAGIHFATDHGARVINLSLGPELPGLLAVLLQGGCISALEDAATYAWNKGRFVAIASGNSGLRSVYDSAALEVVGATGSDDAPASYSNSGADIYAPGGDGSCSNSTCILSTWAGGGYQLAQGTSMATPHVSGIAALLFARGYTNAQIRQRLAATADSVNGILRVNAARAVGSVAGTKTTKPSASSGSGGASAAPGTSPSGTPGSSASGTPTLPNGLTPMPLSTSSQGNPLEVQAAAPMPPSGPVSRTVFISVATGFAMLAGAGYVGRLLRSH